MMQYVLGSGILGLAFCYLTTNRPYPSSLTPSHFRSSNGLLHPHVAAISNSAQIESRAGSSSGGGTDQLNSEVEMGTAYHLDHAMLHSRNRGKCTKMHAHLGPGVDGCQLFDGDHPSDTLCGACGCHLSFHTKLHKYEPLDPESRSKRPKLAPLPAATFEPLLPAESVGDNLDSPGLEVTSQEKIPLPFKPVMDSPLYTRLCAKLRVIQEEYPEEIHGKFSIVHDEEHGFRVYCGGCDKRYGITKPGYGLGNFERGHLASKRHKEVKVQSFLKRSVKTVYCG